MPKKPEIGVAIGSASAVTGLRASNLMASHQKRHLSLRAANLRAFSKKDKKFICRHPIENLTSDPSVNFVCDKQDQERGKDEDITCTQGTASAGEEQIYATPNSFQSHVNNSNDVLGSREMATITEVENCSHLDQDGKSIKPSAGVMAFIRILLHTLSCSFSCQKSSCHKMGMVLLHYHRCKQKRQFESRAVRTHLEKGDEKMLTNAPYKCSLCQQLAKIVGQHSIYQCKLSPNQVGCPVPMCDLMRKARVSSKQIRHQSQNAEMIAL